MSTFITKQKATNRRVFQKLPWALHWSRNFIPCFSWPFTCEDAFVLTLWCMRFSTKALLTGPEITIVGPPPPLPVCQVALFLGSVPSESSSFQIANIFCLIKPHGCCCHRTLGLQFLHHSDRKCSIYAFPFKPKCLSLLVSNTFTFITKPKEPWFFFAHFYLPFRAAFNILPSRWIITWRWGPTLCPWCRSPSRGMARLQPLTISLSSSRPGEA